MVVRHKNEARPAMSRMPPWRVALARQIALHVRGGYISRFIYWLMRRLWFVPVVWSCFLVSYAWYLLGHPPSVELWTLGTGYSLVTGIVAGFVHPCRCIHSN